MSHLKCIHTCTRFLIFRLASSLDTFSFLTALENQKLIEGMISNLIVKWLNSLKYKMLKH